MKLSALKITHFTRENVAKHPIYGVIPAHVVEALYAYVNEGRARSPSSLMI